MPYQVIWEGEGFWARFSGCTSDEELITFAEECSRDDRFETARYFIGDFLGCETTSFSLSLATKLATIEHVSANIDSQLKIAVVADIPDMIALASAYLPLQLSQYEIRVFQVLEEARNWCQR